MTQSHRQLNTLVATLTAQEKAELLTSLADQMQDISFVKQFLSDAALQKIANQLELHTHTDYEELEDQLDDEREELSEKEEALDDVEGELVRLKDWHETATAVHTFDHDDESTWPEDDTALVFVVNGEDEFIESGLSDDLYEGHIWSYHAPALQAHLKSLNDQTS